MDGTHGIDGTSGSTESSGARLIGQALGRTQGMTSRSSNAAAIGDPYAVDDVGLDDTVDVAVAPEGARPWPQWLWSLVASEGDTDVWVHHQAEQSANALWVRPAGPPAPGTQMVQVLSASGKPVRKRRRRKAQPVVEPTTRLLTVSQVAAQLSVDRSTVEKIPYEDLPYAHLGHGTQRHLRRYRPEDVDTYVERQRDRTKQREENAQWARAVSCANPAGQTGTSGSTTRVPGASTESRRTQPTKSSLASAWLKLKGS